MSSSVAYLRRPVSFSSVRHSGRSTAERLKARTERPQHPINPPCTKRRHSCSPAPAYRGPRSVQPGMVPACPLMVPGMSGSDAVWHGVTRLPSDLPPPRPVLPTPPHCQTTSWSASYRPLRNSDARKSRCRISRVHSTPRPTIKDTSHGTLNWHQCQGLLCIFAFCLGAPLRRALRRNDNLQRGKLARPRLCA